MSTDKEREIKEIVAKKIVESDLQPFAQLLLQTIKPLTFIGGELSRFFLSPYLLLLDEKGFEILDVFEKRENIDLLLAKVEELTNNKR